ncbi:MAG: hypothetical protein ACFFE4_09665 [Candidatus Thorarchaeota archaeon]
MFYKRKVYITQRYRYIPEKGDISPNSIKAYFRNIVFISVFPQELILEKKCCIQIAIETIFKRYISYFVKIINSEILKDDLIKIPKNNHIIYEGELLKEHIKNILGEIFLKEKHFSINLERKNNNSKDFWICI